MKDYPYKVIIEKKESELDRYLQIEDNIDFYDRLLDMYEWLTEHEIEFSRFNSRNGKGFRFKHAADATMFKLVWV